METKKTETSNPEVKETEKFGEENNGVIEPITEEKGVFIPDIPAQLEEEKESDEILFLRNLLAIQDNGGWGKHLHPVILERINYLKRQ